MDLQTVQDAYDRALSRLVTDLRAESIAVPSITVDFTRPDDRQYSFVCGSSRHERRLPHVEDVEEATVRLADALQEDVLEMLWGRPWPRCQGHPHPARPQEVARLATWCCPATGQVLTLIGSARA